MTKKLSALVLLILIFNAGRPRAQSQDTTMSLESCILTALKNNLGVAIEIINPELAELSLAFSKEKYIPGLSFGLSSQNTSSASFSWIEAAAKINSQDKSYYTQVSQFVPTGGRFYATLSSYKSESNRSFQTINPRFGSTLTFSFSQPLLRNFGLELNKRDIVIARNNRDMSEIQFRSVLQDTIYKVEQAYWNLVYSIEDLRVRRQSLELARDLLAKNKREAEVGTIAPIEVLNAEAEVATREADILEAEAQVASSQDLLLTILNPPGEGGKPRIAGIIPSDRPAYEKKTLSLDECLLVAMENRTDLQISKLDLNNKEVYYNYARNQLLPDLSLSASYWSPGISGTQILYQDGNPLTGVVVGTVPGGATDSLRDAFRLKYKNWSVGLTLSVPINNFLTRAHFAQISLNRDQALLRIKNQEQQVLLEIKNAVRDVETDYKRVQAYKVARELAEKKLQAEEKKLKVGLTTNYLVLWQQRDLANARSAELKAIIDYNLSLSGLEKALGTSLKSKNIKVHELLQKDGMD
jgi:outer membrane protein TolC